MSCLSLHIGYCHLPIAVYKSSMTKSAWWVGSNGASWPEIFFQPDNRFLLWKVVLLNNPAGSNIITLDYNVAIYCVLKHPVTFCFQNMINSSSTHHIYRSRQGLYEIEDKQQLNITYPSIVSGKMLLFLIAIELDLDNFT